MKKETYTCQHVFIQLIKEKDVEYDKITFPACATEIARKIIKQNDREHFIVLCLDGSNHVVCVNTVHVGTVSSVNINLREVLKPVILSNSCSIIVVHNHPSGDPAPSDNDHRITEKIQEACKLFDIPLLDHVILGDDNKFYSFKDEGLLQ
ncbi:MAG: JAB domain-containing protein [Methanomicrobia archaeon]|nr:JAB domain-containing protein [Methanomicrobia archaeon]